LICNHLRSIAYDGNLLLRHIDHAEEIKKKQNCRRDHREKEQLEKQWFGAFAELDFYTLSFYRFILHFTLNRQHHSTSRNLREDIFYDRKGLGITPPFCMTTRQSDSASGGGSAATV
jgi:hypothetical protein